MFGRQKKIYCLSLVLPHLGPKNSDDCFRSLLRIYSHFFPCAFKGTDLSAEVIMEEFSLVSVQVFEPKTEEETG